MSRFCFPLSLVLAVFLFGASPALAQSFSDVPKEHNYFDAIEYVKSNSIVQGYSDGTFKPDNTINRAEFLKILIEAQFKNSSEVTNCTEGSFSDVSYSDWFAKYACFAKKQGIIKGYADGTFNPSQTITFAEAAKIVVNTMIGKRNEGNGAAWYKPFVEELYDRRIILECSANANYVYAFCPEELITRGFMANIIARMNPIEFFGLQMKTFTGKFTTGDAGATFSFRYSENPDYYEHFSINQNGDTVTLGEKKNDYFSGWEMHIGNDISDKEKLLAFLRPLYGSLCELDPEMRDLGNDMFDVRLKSADWNGNEPPANCWLNYAYTIRYTPKFGGKVVTWELGQDVKFEKDGIALDPIMVNSFQFIE